MSIRRDAPSNARKSHTVQSQPSVRASYGSTGAVCAQEPVTISDHLGMDRPPTRPVWPTNAVHKSKHTKRLRNASSVVDTVFGRDGYYPNVPTGEPEKKGWFAKKAASVLQGAKSAADLAVRAAGSAAANAKSKAGQSIKHNNEKQYGLEQFDYKVYEKEFIAILGAPRKDDGTDANQNNLFTPFDTEKYNVFADVVTAQNAKSTHGVSSSTGDVKKYVSVVAKPERGNLCMGFATVGTDATVVANYNDMVLKEGREKTTVGEPTIPRLQKDSFDVADGPMKPISAIAISEIDLDKIPGAESTKNVNYEFDAIPQLNGTDGTDVYEKSGTWEDNSIIRNFQCMVQGLHVNKDFELEASPTFLVPKNDPNDKGVDLVDPIHDLAMWGIVVITNNAAVVKGALTEAIKGEKVDMALLWTMYKLVCGAKNRANGGVLASKKGALGKLFGSTYTHSSSTTSRSYTDDEYARVFDSALRM
jgi:hypothetical protein